MSTLHRAPVHQKLGLLALGGVVAPILFLVLLIVASSLYPGYRHMTQAVSELGGAEARYPLVQNFNFLVVGALVVAFAVGLHGGVGGGSAAGPILVGSFGVSSGIANALLPCDAGCDFVTLTGILHNLTGLAGFLAGIAGAFVIAPRLRRDVRWRSLATYSVIAGALMLIALVAWIGISKAAGVASVNGLLQRTFIVLWLLWIEVMSLRLLWVARHPTSPAA